MAPLHLVGQGFLFVEALRSDTPHSDDSSGCAISPTQRPLPDSTKHSQETTIFHAPAGFEPATPASERPQTDVLYRTATEIGCKLCTNN